MGTGFCRLSLAWGKGWGIENRLWSGSSGLGQKTGPSRTFKHYFFLSINAMDSLLHIAARIEAAVASYVSVCHVADRAEWECRFEAEKVCI